MPAVRPPDAARPGGTQPEVSVVIPTFNRQDFLPSAIASARAQTAPNIEIIVVDDGSTDCTPLLLGRFAAEEPRLRLVRQENRGLAAARNAGLACARASWIAFLDDDDLWHPEFLSHMLAFVKKHDLPAAVCLTVQFTAPPAFDDPLAALADPERFSVSRFPPHPASGGVMTLGELLLRPLATPNSALLSVDVLRGLGGFDEGLSSAEDYDLWLRLAQVAPIPVLQRVLALYRIHPSRLTSSLGRMAHQTRTVLERFLAMHPEALQLVGKRPLARRLAALYREEAYVALLSGHREAARRSARAAVRRDPFDIKTWGYLALAPWPSLYRTVRRLVRHHGLAE